MRGISVRVSYNVEVNVGSAEGSKVTCTCYQEEAVRLETVTPFDVTIRMASLKASVEEWCFIINFLKMEIYCMCYLEYNGNCLTTFKIVSLGCEFANKNNTILFLWGNLVVTLLKRMLMVKSKLLIIWCCFQSQGKLSWEDNIIYWILIIIQSYWYFSACF